MFAKPRHARSGISGTLAFLEQVYFGTVRGMRKSSGRNAVLGLIGIHDADGRFYYGLLFYVSAVGGQIVADQGRLYALYYFWHRNVHDTLYSCAGGRRSGRADL